MTMDYHNSKEIIKLKELWEETWEKLTIKNPFGIESLAFLDYSELEDLSVISMNNCDIHLTDYGRCSIEEFIRQNYGVKEGFFFSHLKTIFTNYIESINNYCSAHNIQLVNTGSEEWEIIGFMDLFLGDFNNSKVVLWHERYDNESGEFVVFDRKFAEECLSNNKFPEIHFTSSQSI